MCENVCARAHSISVKLCISNNLNIYGRHTFYRNTGPTPTFTFESRLLFLFIDRPLRFFYSDHKLSVSLETLEFFVSSVFFFYSHLTFQDFCKKRVVVLHAEFSIDDCVCSIKYSYTVKNFLASSP